jgi:hypothetical protein
VVVRVKDMYMEATIISFIHQMTDLGKIIVKIEPWIVVLGQQFF